MTCTFSYTGAEQSFVVPGNTSALTIIATGASGGAGVPAGSVDGGLAGTATDEFNVRESADDLPSLQAGQILYVEVGGQGGSGTFTGTTGGFNGGGTAGRYSGGGGGASDVRTLASTTPLTTTDSRLLVAAGGGGAGSGCTSYNYQTGESVDWYPNGGNAGAAGDTGCAGAGGQAGTGAPGQGANATIEVGGGGGGGGGGYRGGGIGAVASGGGGGTSFSIGGTTGLASARGHGSVVITYTVPTQPQTLSFTSMAPSAVYTGQTYTISATGGDSGNPVRFASTTPAVCTITSPAAASHAPAGFTAQVSFLTAGDCTIKSDQDAAVGYTAASTISQTLTVKQTQSQAITFTSSAASPIYPHQTYTATATGGGSDNPIAFSTTTLQVCTIAPATGVVTLLTVGRCTIEADQAAAPGYAAAPTVSQDVTVSAIPTETVITADPTEVVAGQSAALSAHVTFAAGSAATVGGSVQFTIDGTDIASPIPVDPDGNASTPPISRPAGTHTLTAAYTPADAAYIGSSNQTTLNVGQAATSTTLAASRTRLQAHVSVVAPGAGTPTGNIDFLVAGRRVGSVPLSSNGSAALDYTGAANGESVAAIYTGDSSYFGSSDSTSRSNPSITAHLSSAGPGRSGWYRGTVTVTFSCSTDSATVNSKTLSAACPAPLRWTTNGLHAATRTITTTDGGVATVNVAAKIDTTSPRVQIKGITAGKRYLLRAPTPTCVATDLLSGVTKCSINSRRAGSKIVVTASASDTAGNMTRTRKTYRLATYGIEGAKVTQGVAQVRYGETYTLVALGARPRYVLASVSGTPHVNSVLFRRAGTVSGKRRWALGVTMSMATSYSRDWKLGIRQNGHLHVIKIHVTN